MADEKVTTQGPEVPASPPDANTPPQTPPEQTPPPGAKGPEEVTGFHDVIKHPEFQPFLQRQIEEQVAARTADTVAQVLQQMGVTKNGNGNQPDQEAAEDLKKLMDNFEVDEKRAKELISWRDQGIEKHVKPFKERFDVLDLSMRFGLVFQQNADAKQYEPKMLEIFKGMNEAEKNFVMNSQEGATFLYDTAKKRAGILPPAARYAGTSGPSRSTPPAQKIGDADTQVAQAVDALKKGDRASYERIIAQVGRR